MTTGCPRRREVDQSGEQQSVLGFMTHLNQVGQTGSTPRHPKGLSTCCHGEEPHVVGWRFIHERRAISICVMRRVNELLTERSKRAQEQATAISV
jgi:hypothetical protein